MPLTLGSNIASLLAQRRLGQTTSALDSVYERLASGQRINRASDDAAALAISESLKSNSRLYSQASRNINDGISLVSISQSALSALSGVVQRIQELAEQASNGTYSNTQRNALDDEAQALGREYRRIIDGTSYNGIKLLDGSVTSISIQAGIDGSQSSRINITTGSPLATAWDGTFTMIGEYSGGGRIDDVFIADFNGDGHQDLMSHGDSGGEVRITFGNGDGTFSGVTTFGGSGGDDLIGDIDNDGDIDIFTSYSGSYTIARNNGNGTFSLSNIGADMGTAIGRTMTDLDGDGNLDIMLLLTTDSTYTRYGNGDGTFDAAIIDAQAPANISAGIFGDVNEDGIIDLIYGINSQDEIYLALGNGAGTFAAGSLLAVGWPSSIEPVLGDVNNDGHLDLLYASGTGNSRTYLRLGTGSGTFGSEITVATDNITGSIQLYDFNNDGNLDIFRTDHDASRMLIYLGNGDGTYASSLSYSTTAAAPKSAAFADFNEDGVVDFALPTFTGGTIQIYQGGSTGSAIFPTISLLTRTSALSALDEMSSLQTEISNRLSQLGSAMSRLEVAANFALNIKVQFQNAESRLRDVDVADEVGNLIRLQILQKAGTAILAQSNLQPALALSLLKN